MSNQIETEGERNMDIPHACDEWFWADVDDAPESDIDALTASWLRGNDISTDPRWLQLEQGKP